MQTLQTTKAAAVWSYFLHICSIPHISKHEQQLTSWIIDWAEARHINYTLDEVGNLILRKPASNGYEQKTPTILQAHLDMVPQKNHLSDHNFLTDPIAPIIKADWMHATNTTLGADNGIGMASCLAILEDDSINHPPLEVLLTTDEETSMAGAFGLKAKTLQGKILINTDSEQEGSLYVGCAGSVDLNITFPYINSPTETNKKAFEVSLKGLKGGHSGRDIHLQHGNAIKLLVEVLENLKELPFQLSTLEGGNLRNTIPREAHAIIVCDEELQGSLSVVINSLYATLVDRFHHIEDSLELTFQPCPLPETVLSEKCQQDFLNCIHKCDNAVLAMDPDFANVVTSSSNLGVITQNNEEQPHFMIQFLVRSQIEHQKVLIVEQIAEAFKRCGAKYRINGNYPSWKADLDSTIYKTVTEQYQKLFNKTPQPMIIHTGLECGLFSNKYPDLSMISFGPTIKFPHTPGEKVNIPSVDKYWSLLLATLTAIE